MDKEQAHARYRQPAEWITHDACWLAWPSHADLWGAELHEARREVARLALAIAADGRGERLEVLARTDDDERGVRDALAGLDASAVRVHRALYGDIWLRDTAPIFVTGDDGRGSAAACFEFNGWGGKYILEHDNEVAGRIAAIAGVASLRYPFILEGGSVEVDGEGTCLTTRQCLLNPNRGGASERDVEQRLRGALGVDKVLWIDEGLVNDHTDGHIDTLARFVAPGVVVCMEPRGESDPNRAVLEAIARDLSRMIDARGRKLDVVRIPSPGHVVDADGATMPASYVNFYIANESVVVPAYGTPNDTRAVDALSRLFPTRRAVGLSARAILAGGGAFHCITQQQPRVNDP